MKDSKFIRFEQNADTLKIQHAKRVEPTKTKNTIETCAIKNSVYTITMKIEQFSLMHQHVLANLSRICRIPHILRYQNQFISHLKSSKLLFVSWYGMQSTTKFMNEMQQISLCMQMLTFLFILLHHIIELVVAS